MDIVQQFSDYILDFFNLQLMKNGTDRKLAELIADSEEFCQALVREVVTSLLQLKDDVIYKAIKVEKTRYVKERARDRTLVTLLGEITIERRYYQNRKTNTYSALLDEVMDIPKHSRIDVNAQAQIFERVTELLYSHAE